MSTITLEQLLSARDRRAEREHQLLEAFPDASLVVLTVIMPGNVKRDRNSLTVAHAALSELNALFDGKTILNENRDLPTGFEAFFVVDSPELPLKQALASIEDSHPLGRLMDLDVIRHDGSPISRSELGLPARTCMLCDSPARVCMRARSHTQDEILTHINGLIDNYVRH